MSSVKPHQPLEGAALAWLTLALSLATFMNVLDTSIANVAVPTLAGDLAISPDEGTWVITSYVVASAILLPLTGWLAGRFGEVRLFIASALLFGGSSWLCGLSTSLPELIAFRVLQGAVGGLMIPLSQSVLLAHYPPHRKGMALAFIAMTTVIAPIFGPILGGWITDNISWPWIFYINVPVAAISAGMSWRLLQGQETETRRAPLDYVGLGLLIVGVAALQIMLDKGNELDWFGSSTVVTLAVVAVMSLSVFIAWELTDKHPVVDLSLFTLRNFTIGTVALTLGYMVYFAMVVIFPLWLQTQMSYTATWAGIAAAPVGILALVFSPVVGRVAHKVDARIMASVSFLVFAIVSFWSASFNTNADIWQLAAPRLLQGLGMAFFFVPIMMIVLSGLPPNRIASASGLMHFCRVLGGSFGTSLSITLWDRRAALHGAQLSEHFTAFSASTQNALEQLHANGAHGAAALAELAHLIQGQAFMLSTNDFFWLSGWIFTGLLGLIWFARPPFGARGADSAGAH